MNNITENLQLLLCTAAAAAMALMPAGCAKNHGDDDASPMILEDAPSVKPLGQMVKVIAISPALAPEAKRTAAELINSEAARLMQSAPTGAVVHVVDADECRPVATLQAGKGVARIRKRLLMPALAKVSAFLDPPKGHSETDGRLRFPHLCQMLGQARLPAGTPVVVLGNPLFMNDRSDSFFSMKSGSVPSDGLLFQDRKFSLYSVVGRERALAGSLFFWGYPDEHVFQDDSHKQAVTRFWSVYVKAQGGSLVAFQPSIAAAAEALHSGLREPMLADQADPKAKPEMVRIQKVIHGEAPTVVNGSTAAASGNTLAPGENDGQPATASAHTVVPNPLLQSATQDEKGNSAPNISASGIDKFGNPAGDKNDLIHAGQMTGKHVLFVTFDHDPAMESSPVPDALKAKGFDVERVRFPLPQLAAWKAMLASADEAWLISSKEKDHFTKAQKAALIERWKGGMSLYLGGDNQPYFHEANAVLEAIAPGARLNGNFPGDKQLGQAASGPGFANCALFHGINCVFEGNTVSELTLHGGFKAACRHSQGGVLLATLDGGQSSHGDKCGRVVVDGGYTRWFKRYYEEAGAGRLAMNIAGWLAGAGGQQ